MTNPESDVAERAYLTHEDDKDSACEKCGCPYPENATCWNAHLDTLEKLRAAESTILSLREALKEEQERCAKVAEQASNDEDTIAAGLAHKPGEWKHRHASDVAESIAKAIRALSAYRGKTG